MGGPAKARPRSRVPRESPQAQWKGAAAVETARPQRQSRWGEGGPSAAGSGAEEEGGEGGGVRRWRGMRAPVGCQRRRRGREVAPRLLERWRVRRWRRKE